MYDDLLEANRHYAASYALGGVSAPASRGFALVTCMDSRIDPLAILGLVPGDAKIVRNAGGRVTPDVLRSLALAANLLGVRRIAVMQHTDCALARRTDDQIRSGFPEATADQAAGWALLAMPEPDEALRHDVEAVRSCPLLPEGVSVEGWRYRVESGAIDTVVPSSSGPDAAATTVA